MKTPVIIDTDPGIDDILAILLALASPELDVLAIILSYGNTDIESSHRNILKAYHAIDRHLEQHPGDRDRFPNFFQAVKPILARGSAGPLQGDLHSAQYFHGRDGLGDISQRHPELESPWIEAEHPEGEHPQLTMTGKPGVDVALDLILTYPARSITYIALGPLTNVAQILRSNPTALQDRIGRIVCMGGALDVPGNTSPVAEFNFFADPYSVKEILVSKDFPFDRFTLLPLDITTPHELPFPIYIDKVDTVFTSTVSPSVSSEKSPLTHFTSSFLERTREVMLQFGKDAMELHDIATVWFAIENPPLSVTVQNQDVLAAKWKVSRRHFDVERVGELTRGMLVVDRREDETAYAPGANRAEVQAQLDQAKGHHTGDWESTAVPAQVEIEINLAYKTGDAVILHDGPGVLCVTETPGPSVLLDLMLKRIWGVSEVKQGQP